MSEDEILATLRLQCLPKIGPTTAKKLIAHCGSAVAVFEENRERLKRIDGIGTVLLNQLLDKSSIEMAVSEWEQIQLHEWGFWHYLDEDYPFYLKHCIDSPLLLFHKGNMRIGRRKIVSIVGTRNITSRGADFCEKFIADLAPLDPIIVSGFAYGVDICAQRAAVAHGLQTIGCLAHGLNQIYPKAHAPYRDAVLARGGFITEFWSSSQPERENFLRRNRIIAGISEATVVIESAEKGGSLVTASFAAGYNREVYAVPGRVTDKYSKGCNNLIKQHRAQLLTSAADLIYLLGWELPKEKPKPKQTTLFAPLDDTEKQIYTFLNGKGKQLMDDIALQCQLPIFKTSSVLLALEMKGMVRPLPGKFFEVI